VITLITIRIIINAVSACDQSVRRVSKTMIRMEDTVDIEKDLSSLMEVDSVEKKIEPPETVVVEVVAAKPQSMRKNF